MKIGDFNIVLIDKYFKIEKFLKPYSSLASYRQIFMSKEWIQSYCLIYKPKEMVFFYDIVTTNYLLFEKHGNILQCLGDPLNDFNMYGLWDANESEKWQNIIERIKEIENVSVFLNCVTVPLSHRPFNEMTWGLAVDLMTPTNLQISPKLRKLQLKYGNSIQYYRITSSNPDFNQILDYLLLGRQMVLSAKAPEDNCFSLGEHFVSFIRTLCLQPSMRECVYIDYGKVKDMIVSINLSFKNHDCALYYLVWCLHSSNKISYGLLQDMWSIHQCQLNGYRVVDFSRGDEPYKYRLGLNEYKLYNYVI